MKKNKSIKLCRICGEYEGTEVNGKIIAFEKHRNVCRVCRNKYHKNRREDKKDGVRNDLDWYRAEDELSNANTIKKLEKMYNGKTNVFNLAERELKKSDTSNLESIFIFGFFAIIIGVIAWAIISNYTTTVIGG